MSIIKSTATGIFSSINRFSLKAIEYEKTELNSYFSSTMLYACKKILNNNYTIYVYLPNDIHFGKRDWVLFVYHKLNTTTCWSKNNFLVHRGTVKSISEITDIEQIYKKENSSCQS